MSDHYLYEDQFNERHNFSHPTPVKKTLIIASTPRCGSHLLGHTLLNTGKFGFPLEYANPSNVKKWADLFNLDAFDAILDKLTQIRTSPNGVFSIKTHYSHLEQFGGFTHLTKRLPNPHFVLLTRNDALEQAVSLAIARQTGVWISGQLPKNTVVHYDPVDIEFCLKRTLLHNAAWKFLLSSHAFPYLELSFNDVRNNVHNAVQQISDLMNEEVDLAALPETPPTQKQSNDLNKEWIERYLNDTADKTHFIDLELALGQKSRKRQLKELIFK